MENHYFFKMYHHLAKSLRHATSFDAIKPAYGINPRGDVSQPFDMMAEERILDHCRAYFPKPVCIWSEESGKLFSCEKRIPEQIWIVDPVDGSENFARNLPLSGVSLAVFPYHSTIRMDQIQCGLMGNIPQGYAYLAIPGQGVWDQTGQRIRCSKTQRLQDAVVGYDFNFNRHPVDERILDLIPRCKDLRRMGSTVCELMFVADGRYDAYLDIRNESTPENFLAAIPTIREAGGVITDMDGNSWDPFDQLTETYTIVAAATSELHQEILEWLHT